MGDRHVGEEGCGDGGDRTSSETKHTQPQVKL